jgi:DNA polymerase-1
MDIPTLFDDAHAAAPSDAGVTGPLRLRAALPVQNRHAGRVPARHRRTLLAVDGDSLTHRAFHAYGAAGTYGVLALLAGVADHVSFDAVVVGFDARGASWRRKRWPDYKAQRPPKPDALTALLEQVPSLLARLGVAVVCQDGHEADDVLGSAAALAATRGWCSVLATSDRDAFSLVDDRTTVLRLRAGLDNAIAMTPGHIRRTVGVDPSQYVMFAALRGDTSDNLPGVAGIGPTRAKALLAAFPTIEAAVADEIGCRSVLGPQLGQALIDDLASADSVVRRNVELMTIGRDVAIDLDDCGARLPYDAVEQLLVAEGLGGVAGRFAAAFGARPEAPPPPAEPWV